VSPGASPLGGPRNARDRRRRRLGAAFAFLCGAATLVGVASLAVLLWDLAADGLPRLDGRFLTSFASRLPERAGVKAALAGSAWLLGLTALIAFPVSVAAAIYLE